MTSGDWPADKVERWPLDRLVPYARNARTHDDTQVAQIAASIREWGWTTPILVDEKGMIIAGHGRVLAARQLGLQEAPVMVARGWSEAQCKAYVLADNKLAESAGWDKQILMLEVADLDALGFDLSLIGFSDRELTSFAAAHHQGLTDPDDVPDAPAVPVSQIGDVWHLGPHRLASMGSSSRPRMSTSRSSAGRTLRGRWPRWMRQRSALSRCRHGGHRLQIPRSHPLQEARHAWT